VVLVKLLFPQERMMNWLLAGINCVTQTHNMALSISNTRLLSSRTLWKLHQPEQRSRRCLQAPQLKIASMGIRRPSSSNCPIRLKYQALFPRRQSGRGVKLTSQHHLVSRLRISGTIPPLPHILSYRSQGLYFTLLYTWNVLIQLGRHVMTTCVEKKITRIGLNMQIKYGHFSYLHFSYLNDGWPSLNIL
jgi:hypothetical protein